jgi:hypothetical protein
MQLRNRLPPEVYMPRDKNPYRLYPPLCFSGFSRGVNTRHAVVEGTVRMGEDGIIRWQFVSHPSLRPAFLTHQFCRHLYMTDTHNGGQFFSIF